MDINSVWFVGIGSSVIGSLVTVVLGRIFLIPAVLAKRRNDDILDDLAELRGEGVQIQNSGLRHMSQSDRDIWIVQAEEWKERMYAKVAEKSNSDSMNLRTLGTFSVPTVQGVTDPLQLNKLGDLIETIRRLKELTDTYR